MRRHLMGLGLAMIGIVAAASLWSGSRARAFVDLEGDLVTGAFEAHALACGLGLTSRGAPITFVTHWCTFVNMIRQEPTSNQRGESCKTRVGQSLS